MTKRTLLLLVVTILSLAGYAQAPTVHTRIMADTIMIGDQVTMEVDINKDVATDISIPQLDKGLTPDVEVIGMPRIDTTQQDGRNLTVRLSYTITSFKAGTHAIPGFPIVYTDKNVADTITSLDMMQLVVQTFEIDTTKQQIADIKQPMEAPLQWAEVKEIVLYGAIGALILAIVIYLVIKFIKSRRAKIAARPAEPPHITAIRELEKLHSEKLPQAARYKEYYSRMTDTIRTYIENRYAIQAMEMTTPQIVEAINEVNHAKVVALLSDLFTTSDLVKFAKWTPSVDECEEAFQTAYYYVEETKILTTTPVEQDA